MKTNVYPNHDESPASSSQSSATKRFQPYRFIHKGLRSLLTQTLLAAGRMDTSNPSLIRETVVRIDQLLDVMHDHLSHENHFFHDAVRKRKPSEIASFDADHDGHVIEIRSLRAQCRTVLDGQGDTSANAYDLYLHLSRFVAENFLHMADEESRLTQVLWENFTDEEILDIHDSLISSLSPEENAYYLKLMIPELNHPERVQMLSGMRAGMPTEVFSGVLALVKSVLDEYSVRQLTTVFED